MLRSSLFPGLVGLLVPLEEERPGLDEGSHTVAHCTQPQHQPGEDNYLQYTPSPLPPLVSCLGRLTGQLFTAGQYWSVKSHLGGLHTSVIIAPFNHPHSGTASVLLL